MKSNLYETWILKQEIPEPFAGIVQKNGGRRTSLKQEDCSRYNTGRAKSAVLHPPTLRAILSLLRLMDGRESGAAGHQDSNGEEYMAVFAYLSIDGNDGLCDTEFASHFFNLHEHFAGHKILGEEALLHCAFVCCDNLYRRIESGSAIGEGAVPLEESQIGNPEFIPQNLLRTGVYSPNTTDYGEFEILSTKPILQETTIG